MAETRAGQSAHFDASMIGVVVNHVVVTDAGVLRGPQWWTSGEWGPIVDDPSVPASVNLEFVTEVIKIGGHVLSAVGQTHDAKSLKQMIKDLGDRTACTTMRPSRSPNAPRNRLPVQSATQPTPV